MELLVAHRPTSTRVRNGEARNHLRDSGLLATRGGRFLLYSSFTTDIIAGLLIGVDGASQIAEIMERDDLNDEQKRNAVLRVVTNLVVTGGLLAISYRDVAKMGTRLNDNIGGDAVGNLSMSTKMTLSLFDDDTLKALKGAREPDLDRLAGVLRDDPGSLGRLMARRDGLLPALRKAAGGTPLDLELAFLDTRMKGLGIPTDAGNRIGAAARSSGMQAKAVFDLDDATLKRLAKADEKLAAGKVPDAMAEFDTMALPSDVRGRMESSMAKAHGQKDPAYDRDPKAALLRDFPDLPRPLATSLAKLDDDALKRLAGATEEQVVMMAKIAQFDTAAGNQLLKHGGPDLFKHKLEVSGSVISINGQIEIHPGALARVSADDLPKLLDKTNPLDKAGLALFTKSSPYRFRFRFQLEENETWLSKLLDDAGLKTDPKAVKLLGSIDDAGRMRLNEPRTGSYLSGIKKETQEKAAKYALKRATDVRDFVNHFEMYVSEVNRVRKETMNEVKRRIKNRPSGQSEREAAKLATIDLLGQEIHGFKKQFNEAILAKITDDVVANRYGSLKTELGKRTGTSKLGKDVTVDNAVGKVQSASAINFGTESAAVYHANKHHAEIPAAHASGPGNHLTQYLDSARETIRLGTGKAHLEQDGAIKVVFQHNYPDGTKMTALIRVGSDGQAVLATYGKSK